MVPLSVRAVDSATMTTSWATATLVAATITNGLMAGLFAAYSYAVMPGLGRADDRTFVEAMQQTNAAILDGWFGICFGGALVFAAAAAVLHLGRPGLPWIVAGLVLYAAVLVITFRMNVPLNDRLAAAGVPRPSRIPQRFVRRSRASGCGGTSCAPCVDRGVRLPGGGVGGPRPGMIDDAGVHLTCGGDDEGARDRGDGLRRVRGRRPAGPRRPRGVGAGAVGRPPARRVGRIVGDVRDDAAVRAAFAHRFDAVCHLAALVRVRDSRADPLGYWRTNVGGTLAVLEALAAQEGPPARLVVASTCAVYGEQGAVPITEDAPTQPTHPYGASKLAADRAVADLAATGVLGAVSLRAFNVAGGLPGHADRDDTPWSRRPSPSREAGRRS